jgi:mannose-6-phosphate isomerase-like protein (cupin superfamily)
VGRGTREIEISAGAETDVPGPGEACHFDTCLPHRFRNNGDEACEIFSVSTPSTL